MSDNKIIVPPGAVEASGGSSRAVAPRITEAERAELGRLLTRVEREDGPNYELEEQIAMHVAKLPATVKLGHEVLGNERVVPVRVPTYTCSLDAAVALAERALPGWLVSFEQRRGLGQPPAPVAKTGEIWTCCTARVLLNAGQYYTANAATGPLAILAASLRALLGDSEEPMQGRSPAPSPDAEVSPGRN